MSLLRKVLMDIFDKDKRQLRRLMNNISADQAQIFLKTAHRDAWEVLKSRASEEKTPPKVVYRGASRLSSFFKIAVGGVLGATIYHYSRDVQIAPDESVLSPYVFWGREKSAAVADWAKETISSLYNGASGTLKEKREENSGEEERKNISGQATEQKAPFKFYYHRESTPYASRTFSRITFSDVNLRKEASYKSESVGVAKEGGCVTVLRMEEGNWVRVEVQDKSSNKHEGYMAGSRLVPITDAVTECSVDLSRGQLKRIRRSDVNVRSEASHKAKSLGVAKQGGCVTVLGMEEGNWARIEARDKSGNGYEGYMAGSRLAPTPMSSSECLIELKR